MTKIEYIDLSTMSFAEAWNYQEKLFKERVDNKLQNRKLAPDNQQHLDDKLLFVEHPHVYTLGKSGQSSNLLISDSLLKRINATYFHIDRGGDITYHGPGQIVGYPIFDLDHFKIHLKQYVYGLEESIIITLKNYGINGQRLEGATGVWLEPGTPRARKICAIGVKASRYITMHGFAFNVNTDLNYFTHINPCGFIDKGVTSLQNELGIKQNIEEVKIVLKNNLIGYFNALKD